MDAQRGFTVFFFFLRSQEYREFQKHSIECDMIPHTRSLTSTEATDVWFEAT